nr:MAG: hypothetical protein [Lake Baikal virophage 9]
MSSASMQGSTRYVSSLKEGGLLFSDGSTQTTAYTATTNSDGTTDLSLANLTVTDSATIETCYVGSNASTSGLVIYGNCSQLLSDTTTTQYGQNTLNNVTSGKTLSNTAFGSVCLNNLSIGSNNCGMGYATLQNCTTGSYNTGIGQNSMPTLSTSGYNTALGANSGESISTGTGYNTCLGYGSDSAYSYSTSLGYNSACTSDHQIMLGTANETVYVPNKLTVVGFVNQTLPNYCTQYGTNNLINNTGVNNTSIGYGSLSATGSGSYNVSVGDYSLQSNTSGQYNTSIGHFSSIYNQTGEQNTSVGASALQNNTSGSYNTAIGFGAGSSASGSTSTMIGYNATCNTYSNSTALGQSSACTANHQVMIGTSSENVIMPGTVTIGELYTLNNTVNINGGFNVNNIDNTMQTDNVINGATNSIYGATENVFQSALNSLNSTTTNITGDLNIGTSSTSTSCSIEGNSIVGSSSTNSATFNAVPNFVNGFACSGGNPFILYCGTATYINGTIDDSGAIINSDGTISIPPQVNSGGTGLATYTLDQDVLTIKGCFINAPTICFAFWYYEQPSGISNQITVGFSNLATTSQLLPTTISYILFC